jgi:3-polyprenyl-4-hydroxybenzoate decarboxylase
MIFPASSGSVPVKEKNLTIVESSMITIAKIKMNTKEDLLVRSKCISEMSPFIY